MGDHVEERRARQVSSITDKTIGCSTQHSEENGNIEGHRSSCSPSERPFLRRNFSNLDQMVARSRGISNELNMGTT